MKGNEPFPVPGQTMAGAERRPLVVRNVKQLPPAARQLLEEYFIEGATLEGAAEAVNENEDFQVTLGAVAHTELQPEIDAQADEQHEKRDRDQIQRADEHQANSRSNGQSNDQADDDRENDTRGAQRQPKDHQHCENRDGRV